MKDEMKENIKLKFKIKPRLLDHLGISAYSKYSKAIGELVQNGYDADATEVRVSSDIEEDTIFIADNGSGMNETNIKEEFLAIGSGHKREIKLTPKFKRKPRGNKGIGKFAGFGIANIIEIETVKDGVKLKLILNREKINEVSDLNDYFLSLEKTSTNEENGTLLKLKKLHKNIKIDPKVLRGFLARDAPNEKNFTVHVNTVKCEPKHIPANKTYDIEEFDDLCGCIKGKIIITRKAIEGDRGVYTTVNGRPYGKPSFFGIANSPHRFFFSLFPTVTGQIEISSFDKDNENGVSVIKTDREGFNEDDPRYKRYYEIMTEVLKKILYEQEEEMNKKRTDEIKEEISKAIKNVRDAFNEYNKEMFKTTTEEKTRTKVDPDGSVDVLAGSPKHEKTKLDSNPLGITDNSLKTKLKGTSGIGNVRLGDKNYKITTEPRGIEDPEVNIDDEIMVININSVHPAYEQAIIEHCMEITTFRAIAIAWSYKNCVENRKSLEEMYDAIDKAIRFHAEWTQRNKKRRKVTFISVEDN